MSKTGTCREKLSVSGRKQKSAAQGQVLAEYALMLVTCAIFSLLFLVLLAACSMYGARVISLVSWEPDPPSRSQMESVMHGKL